MANSIPYSVLVFCGSRFGTDAAFQQATHQLGNKIADAGMRLVYGAGDVGLMGEVANAVMEKNGPTFGVIPRHLFAREVGKTDLDVFVVTENMHERKKVMFENSDAIVALPGGPGTLDELFEVLTWRQLGLHNKPVILLNTDNYWAPLIELVAHMAAKGFCEPSFVDYLEICATPEAVMAKLEADRK